MHLKIKLERLQRMLEQVGHCGVEPGGGYTRLAFSVAEKAARQLMNNWLEEIGFQVRTDAAGNMIARKEGRENLPAIVLGSHLDTVPQGGLFDGALGVIAAIECALTCAEQGIELRHPIEIIAFADEEGTALGGTFGSRVMVGMLTEQDLSTADYKGLTLKQQILGSGLDPAKLHTARRSSEEFAAYLELHVEQGPVLYRMQVPVGIVNRIVGYRRFSVTLHGQPNHAGTTPMLERLDPLMAACSLIVNLRDYIVEQVRSSPAHGTVLTVGAMKVEPGVHNIIPSQVVFSIDVRDSREEFLEDFESRLNLHLASLNLSFEVERYAYKAPVPMSTVVQEVIATVAEEKELRYHRLTSGAGHDAMCMARLTPTAMIFVPSRDGLSHCPEEDTDWNDAAIGADLLLSTLLRLDNQL